MSTMEEFRSQEAQLKNKLEQSKNIDERRKLRADLRALKAKKESFDVNNGGNKPPQTVSSKFVMSMNRRSDDFENKSKLITGSEQIKINLPVNEQGQESKNTRTTYKFEMKSAKTNGPTYEEKRVRRNQDENNNQSNLGATLSAGGPPKRMTRRASLAELFKLDEDANKARSSRGPTAVAQAPEPPRRVVSAGPARSSTLAPPQEEDTTKHDLLQNLGRLRQRRRSIREIQNRDELEGLMYVKQGDSSVKLISTEGEEQRRMRRSSRKEERSMKIEETRTETVQQSSLSPLKEESPSASKSFTYGTASTAKTFGAPKAEPPRGRGRYEPPAPRPAPEPSRFAGGGRPQPKSFLADKNEDAEPPQKLGSVSDRMAYFRQAAATEKKAAAKSMPTKTPPAPVPTPTATTPGPKSPTERVSLKKAPDPSRAPRELGKKKPPLKRQMSVSSLILTWCKDVTAGYNGVNITNFSGSFASGLAFCALIHKFNPDKFDFDSLSAENRRYNFQLAFDTATACGVPALLDVEDMFRMKKPEPRSVQCYVQMIFSKYRPKDLDMSNLRIA